MSTEREGFPVTAEEIDREMRRQLRRASVGLLGTSVALIALFVLLSVLGGWDLLLILSIAMFVLLGLGPVDMVARFPRPRPAVVDGAVELRGSRALLVVMAVFCILLAVCSALLLAEPGSSSSAVGSCS